MNLFGTKIKQLREQNKLFQKHIAARLDIDTPMLSKIERGLRFAKREQIPLFAEMFKTTEDDLVVYWLADKMFHIGKDETVIKKAVQVLLKNLD